MKKSLKLLVLTVTILYTLSVSFSVGATEYVKEQIDLTSYKENLRSLYLASVFKESYNTITVSKNSQTIETEYPENFGGLYIDNDNNLHISYVNSLDSLKKKELNKNYISYDHVTYSFNYLSSIVDCLTNVMIDMSISSVYVDETINKVIISTNDNNIPAITDYLRTHITNFYVESIDFCPYIESNCTQNPGTIITANGASCTLGFNVLNRETQKWGFVTCGHGISVGDKIKKDNLFKTTLGTVQKRQFGGSIDACYAEYKSQSNIVVNDGSGVALTGTFASSEIVTGMSVYKTGIASYTQAGKVISTNASVTLQSDGVTLTDQIQLEILQIPGDSGAPVYRELVGPMEEGKPRPTTLLGIATVTSSNNSIAYASKVQNILEIFGLNFCVQA